MANTNEPYSRAEYLRALNEPVGEGGLREEGLAAANAAEEQLRSEQAAERYRARLAEAPPVPDTRAEVARALRAYEQEMEQSDNQPPPPPPGSQHLPPGLKLAPGQGGGIDMGKVTGPKVPDNYQTPAEAIPGNQINPTTNQSAESLLDLTSGGIVSKVLEADALKGQTAKKEVTEKGLTGISEEERLRAFIAATGATPQQARQFVRVNPSWVPANRTAASGATGMDPESRDQIMTLQKGSEINQEEAFRQGQEAEGLFHQQMLEVQNNRLEAEKRFRDEHQRIQQRYDTERAEQMAELQRIQDAMKSLGKQPRTIREWLDTSGTGKQVTYGLAVALSALGGAIGRRGNQPLQDLFNRTQANINAKVEQEKETHARLGERAKLNDTIYTRIRQAANDDQAALNITKAMYYDAVGQMVEQVATQYKLDIQSPQLLDFMSKLAKERQALIADTALKIQEQSSQTDRFNPGGVFAVGGGAAGGKEDPGKADRRKRVEEYAKVRADLKIVDDEQTMEAYDNVIRKMEERGIAPGDKIWQAIAAGATNDPKFKTLFQELPSDKQDLVGQIFQAGEVRLHTLSGANTTGIEMLRDIAKHGGYSIQGLRTLRNNIDAARQTKESHLNSGWGGDPTPDGGFDVANEYADRFRWDRYSNPNLAPNSRSVQPRDVQEKRTRGGAKVQ